MRRSFSPHAWGCTGSSAWQLYVEQVFPTCVGMYRTYLPASFAFTRFPHMRGDVPRTRKAIEYVEEFSPHAWGCTDLRQDAQVVVFVFPTCVGMYRKYTVKTDPYGCFPHMRGDVPRIARRYPGGTLFSPHAWGCTAPIRQQQEEAQVFPTCVGMYRVPAPVGQLPQSFPHMRGDVPPFLFQRGTSKAFSPHAWGCTGNCRRF